jgi:hypothetical protein
MRLLNQDKSTIKRMTIAAMPKSLRLVMRLAMDLASPIEGRRCRWYAGT